MTDVVGSTPRSEYTDMITTSYGRCSLQYLDVVGSTPRSQYTEMITTYYGRCSLQYLDVEVIQCFFCLPALIRHVTFPINSYTLTSTTSQCMWLFSVVSVRKINNLMLYHPNFRTLQTIDTSIAKEPFNIIFAERHEHLLPPQTARFCRSLRVKTSFNKVEFDWSTFCERESNATTSIGRRIV